MCSVLLAVWIGDGAGECAVWIGGGAGAGVCSAASCLDRGWSW